MISDWTSHLQDEEEKKRFENEVRGSRRVLDRLTDMLSRDLKGLEAAENNAKIYDLPNWDYRQAHRNGNRQVYQTVLKIINLDQKENNDPTGKLIREPARPA